MADVELQSETILPADASALVTTAEGGLEFIVSNGPEDADMPPNVQLLCAIMLRSKDPKWVGEMITWLEAQNSGM